MELNQEYQQEMSYYFYLSKRICDAYIALEDLRYRHDNRNYYTSVMYHELGFSVQNFRIAREVNDFVDSERLILDRITRLEKRSRYFETTIDKLPSNERNYLIEKYKQFKDVKTNSRLENKAIKIIEEMEEYKFRLSRYKHQEFEKTKYLDEQKQFRLEQINKLQADYKELIKKGAN